MALVICHKVPGSEGQLGVCHWEAQHLVPVLRRRYTLLILTLLFAATKYLLDVDNIELEVVTFGNLNFGNKVCCTMPENHCFLESWPKF